MKLTPQEKRIVEICKKCPYSEQAATQLEITGSFEVWRFVEIIQKLSHSLEARAKRKARVKVVRGWVQDFGENQTPSNRFGMILHNSQIKDSSLVSHANATLTIELPRKVRGKS